MQNIHSQTFISSLISQSASHGILKKLGAFVFGYALLVGTAQISIVLPFTPVPITGQTFGVTLLALLWGRKLGLGIVATYLVSGFLGAPVFATALSGIWGPTLGYLLGMFLSAALVGELADRGWSRSFPRALIAGFLGSLCVYTLGLTVLIFFAPLSSVFALGMLPFIPGDIIKTTLAAGIASQMNRSR
jgi:biotin transport system substrate-specific component